MIRKTKTQTLIALGAAALLSGAAASTVRAATMEEAMDITANWPADAQKAARDMAKLRGAPDEATATMLVWHNSGPWKRIIASNKVTPHNFPGPHPDSVEQTLSYKVPENKFNELARFDGSVTVDRTRGEMAARCDAEHHNVLALNLAHDIIIGKRSVDNARAFYARAVKIEMTKKEIHPYALKLNFSPMMGANDPDHIAPIMRPVVRQMREMKMMQDK